VTKKSEFTLRPARMTKVWLKARTDDEIRQLLVYWQKDGITYSSTTAVRREADYRSIPW